MITLGPVNRVLQLVLLCLGFLDTDDIGLLLVQPVKEALAGRGLPGPTSLDLIPALVERGKARAGWFYKQLNEQLGKYDYIGRNSYSAADITAQCAIDFGSAVSLGIPDDCPNVARWHEVVSARPTAAN